MDPSRLLSQLDQLDDDIDDLSESLTPLLEKALSVTTSKLPLLDKAKLYVLITYAIESILFSYLRLHGVKARDHPVFTELTRVKQYFAKIKNVEEPAGKSSLALDVSAAGRFIKAGLAGNDKYDTEKAERIAKEKARAHIRFNEISKEISKKRKADDSVDAEDNEAEDDSSDAESESEVEIILDDRKSTEEESSGDRSSKEPQKKEKNSRKRRKSPSATPIDITTENTPATSSSESKISKRALKKQKRKSLLQDDGGSKEDSDIKGRKKRGKKEKAEKGGELGGPARKKAKEKK